MGLYDNIERAARDPHYRMIYEQQRRQESEQRHAARMQAAFQESEVRRAAARPQASAGSAFSFSSSPVSDSSSSSYSGGNGDAAAFAIGLLAAPVIIAVIFIVNYWEIILKWSGLIVMFYGAGSFLVTNRQRLPLWVVVPIIWVSYGGLALMLVDYFKLSPLLGAAAAGVVALWVGTAIWPGKDDTRLNRTLGALCWICALSAFFGAVYFSMPMIVKTAGPDTGRWIVIAIGMIAACLTWGAFHPLRRAFAE